MTVPRERRLSSRSTSSAEATPVDRGQGERLADRARAEDHHMLARRNPPSGHGAHGDRDRFDERGEQRIEVADREDLRGRKNEPLLERTVGVDAR